MLLKMAIGMLFLARLGAFDADQNFKLVGVVHSRSEVMDTRDVNYKGSY